MLLRTAHAAPIALGLAKNTTLRRLNLSHNELKDANVQTILLALVPPPSSSSCSGLKSLALANVGLTSQSASSLAQVLRHPRLNVTELDISANQNFGELGMAILSTQLVGEIGTHVKLRRLIIKQMGFTVIFQTNTHAMFLKFHDTMFCCFRSLSHDALILMR